MIGKDGTPKPELFVEDGLHLTPEGYKAWTQMLRPHLKAVLDSEPNLRLDKNRTAAEDLSPRAASRRGARRRS